MLDKRRQTDLTSSVGPDDVVSMQDLCSPDTGWSRRGIRSMNVARMDAPSGFAETLLERGTSVHTSGEDKVPHDALSRCS